ncbi:NAD-dependent epimerase/dehydratase family protein [Tardiphaga sp. 42S5]|uniref:NAD-dependent epimerase/dehydratase family protein n=1 Tax=Tardiphaga sp. 42S5 TaxID=1404799 RepID=UPI002A5A18B4|nr:NAD-dependent epimerase/dehydratase family protein [Tardiphaga sp. 42S5]WPO42676.1 NAD-dependent epimerase/dehydratase family protein [Tardiphaga sp. 42S5]
MRLFVFGLGYSANRFIAQHGGQFTGIAGTVRTAGTSAALAPARGIETLVFNPDVTDPRIADRLADADLLLVSIPPGADSDPVLQTFGSEIAASGIRRIVYLSSVGVYGDHQGAWIDETAPVSGEGRRKARIDAEAGWRALAGDRATILRIAGIYGPGRNALENLKAGKAHRIVKPGQVFNRIHVDDIVAAIAAAFDHAQTGIFNLCDDEPAPPQDVVTYAAALMGIAPPPEQDFATAEMSPMARSFYASNNRISNARLKRELGVKLAFPTYREGLTALWQQRET